MVVEESGETVSGVCGVNANIPPSLMWSISLVTALGWWGGAYLVNDGLSG